MAKKKGTGNNGQLSLFGGSTTQQLNNQLADIERKITALYGSTYKYAAQLAQVRAAVNSGQEFTWQENPAAAKAIEQRLNAVANTLDGQLSKATERSFALGQASTEHALTKALGKDKATKQEVEDINADAAAEMRRRGADGHTYYTQKRGGVSISDKVWNITESTKLEIEIAIQNAALEGQSADDLARTIQQYLEHPERLFRSVRVKDPVTGEWTGEYRMSKAAQQCHPGQGVYRSSYKNALRLARTELTQAYRRAEWESYQDNPLITGYRIELSNNHTTTVVTKKGRRVEPLRDICDEMAGTQYPKTFLWTGWHPQCRCRMVPITITTDDFKERVKARHRGKLDEWKPKEQTTEMPAAFTKWVDENKHRWQQPGHSAPFFIRDNYQQGNVAKGLDTRITAELEQARLAAEAIKAKEPPTPQPITDFDNEVMELRNIAAKFGIDLGAMEKIRAEGENKKELRKAINMRQRLWHKREKQLQDAITEAENALAAAIVAFNSVPQSFKNDIDKAFDVFNRLQETERRINNAKSGSFWKSAESTAFKAQIDAEWLKKKIEDEIRRRSAMPVISGDPTQFFEAHKSEWAKFVFQENRTTKVSVAEILSKLPEFAGLTESQIKRGNLSSVGAGTPGYKIMQAAVECINKGHQPDTAISMVEYFAISQTQRGLKSDIDEVWGYGTSRGYIQTGWSMTFNRKIREGRRLTPEEKTLRMALDDLIGMNEAKQDYIIIRYDDAGFLAFYGINIEDYGFGTAGRPIGDGSLAKKMWGALETALGALAGRSFVKTDYTSFSLTKELNVFTGRTVETTIHVKTGQHVYISKNYVESEGILPRNIKIKVNSARRLNNGGKLKIEIDAEIEL